MISFRLLGCYLIALACSGQTKGAIIDDPDAQEAKPVQFVLRLDKSIVTPGESVRLEQLKAVDEKVAIRTVSYHVLRIGEYNAKLQCLVNLACESFRSVDCLEEFRSLADTGYSHPIVLNSTTRAIEDCFQPKCLGIYLITVWWGVEGRDNYWISSTPVVLVVKAPKDAKGHNVVKPEWLEKQPKIKIIEQEQGPKSDP